MEGAALPSMAPPRSELTEETTGAGTGDRCPAAPMEPEARPAEAVAHSGGGGPTIALTGAINIIATLLEPSHRAFQDVRQLLQADSPLPHERAERWKRAAHVDKALEAYRGLFWLLATTPLDDHSVEQRLATDSRDCSPSESSDLTANILTVARAYLKYRPAAQYVPGLASLLGLLLRHVPDPEEAFWLLVALLEDHRLVAFLDDRSFVALAEAFTSSLPHPVGEHLLTLPIPVAEYLRPWLTSVFTAPPFPSPTAERILDLVLAAEPDALHPLRIASGLHALFKDDILRCDTAAAARTFLQHSLPAAVTTDVLARTLALGDWYYLRIPFPVQVIDALSKAPKLSAQRASQLMKELTPEYALPRSPPAVPTTLPAALNHV